MYIHMHTTMLYLDNQACGSTRIKIYLRLRVDFTQKLYVQLGGLARRTPKKIMDTEKNLGFRLRNSSTFSIFNNICICGVSLGQPFRIEPVM